MRPRSVEPHRYRDRHDAGRRLAGLLAPMQDQRPVVLAIPRGGVPVAAEVAARLNAPLDVVVTRKLGAPANPEYGIGAVSEGGTLVVSESAVRQLQISPQQLSALIAATRQELQTLTERLRDGRLPLPVQGRPAILVDDGLATGRTARAAAASLRRRGASRVILAVPVAARASAQELSDSVDEIVCEQMPDELWAIGYWYEDFSPTSEQEVVDLLAASAAARQEAPGGGQSGTGDGSHPAWDEQT